METHALGKRYIGVTHKAVLLGVHGRGLVLDLTNVLNLELRSTHDRNKVVLIGIGQCVGEMLTE